eukprot:1603588-Pyramimonas_sp.AAC.1
MRSMVLDFKRTAPYQPAHSASGAPQNNSAIQKHTGTTNLVRGHRTTKRDFVMEWVAKHSMIV